MAKLGWAVHLLHQFLMVVGPNREAWLNDRLAGIVHYLSVLELVW